MNGFIVFEIAVESCVSCVIGLSSEQAEKLCKYLRKNWGPRSQWADTWADFTMPASRHRTNNIAERLFRTILYQFLGGRVNKRVSNLLLVVIDDLIPFFNMRWASVRCFLNLSSCLLRLH